MEDVEEHGIVHDDPPAPCRGHEIRRCARRLCKPVARPRPGASTIAGSMSKRAACLECEGRGKGEVPYPSEIHGVAHARREGEASRIAAGAKKVCQTLASGIPLSRPSWARPRVMVVESGFA